MDNNDDKKRRADLHMAVRAAIIDNIRGNPCGYVAAVGGTAANLDAERLVLDGTFDIKSLTDAVITACAFNVGRTS